MDHTLLLPHNFSIGSVGHMGPYGSLWGGGGLEGGVVEGGIVGVAKSKGGGANT